MHLLYSTVDKTKVGRRNQKSKVEKKTERTKSLKRNMRKKMEEGMR